MEENKNIQTGGGIIKSDNTEGNPWHSGKDGEFTSPPKAEGSSALDEVKDNAEQGQTEVPPQKKLKKPQKSLEAKMQVKEKLALKNYFGENPKYDKEKIKAATIEQLKELQQAETELENEMLEISSSSKLVALNKGGISGPWKDTKYPSDYEKLLKSGSFEKKKYYFEHTFMGSEEQKQEMLSLLDELKAKGEKYIAKEKEIHAKYDKYRELVDSYNDTDTYSQHRKDNALWFSNSTQTAKKLEEPAKTYLDNLSSSDYEAYKEAVAYTYTYNRVNMPLRGLDYYETMGEKEDFVKRVNAITRAIDGQELEEDMWIRRGVGQLSTKNIYGNGELLDNKWSTEQLLSLVGTTFVDQGFVSCRSSKDDGYGSGEPVQMFIYCPKTTHALYIKPYSHYISENEMIIQRGYQYRITKAYKKGNQVCIDCEVLLGTDSKKYDDVKLHELAEKHYKI